MKFLKSGSPETIRDKVHDLFEDYGSGGGYIISTADHFFDTPVENLTAYAHAAHECVY